MKKIDKKVFASKHCMERYQEYCNDQEDPKALIGSLINHFRRGHVVTTPPDWVEAKRPNQKYLVVGENIVFPLVEEGQSYVALTCLHRQYSEKRKRTKLITF